MDMGAMGAYQIFSIGGQAVGGMMNKPPMVPVPNWLYYINVADIDAAIDRVKTGGGQILNGPMQVPGGDWIIQGKDPQGAMFALVGRKT
jgi:predicted enzyme related to lactoylglutathione lyase